MNHHRRIARSAGIINLGTLVSRILGFIRDIVTAAFFGTGREASAFVVAFMIPNLLRDLIGEGATNAAFVPVLSETKLKRTEEQYWHLARVIFNLLTIALLVVTVLGIVFAPVLVRLIAPGFAADPAKFRLTIILTRILFPYIFLVGLMAYGMGVLNSLKHFGLPSFAQGIINLSMIVCTVLLYKSIGIYGLVIGVLLGGVLQAVVHLPVLFRYGFHFSRRPEFTDPAAGKILKLLGPRALGAGVYQISIIVTRAFASFEHIVGAGVVPALYYANRFFQLPLALFGISLAQAALPTMSEHASRNDHESLRRTVVFSLRGTFFVCIPASAGLIFLGQPIIRQLLERGRFTAYSTSITSQALLFLALGLFAHAGIKVLVSAFYAMQDTLTPVKTAALSLIVNVAAAALLMFPFKIAGLALATTLAAAFNFFILFLIIQRKIGPLGGAGLWALCAKLALISLVMGMSSYNIYAITENLFLGIGYAVIVFYLLSLALRIEEAGKLLSWISKKR